MYQHVVAQVCGPAQPPHAMSYAIAIFTHPSCAIYTASGACKATQRMQTCRLCACCLKGGGSTCIALHGSSPCGGRSKMRNSCGPGWCGAGDVRVRAGATQAAPAGCAWCCVLLADNTHSALQLCSMTGDCSTAMS